MEEVIFETSRTLIREFKLSDADQVLSFYNDLEVLKYMSSEPWATPENKTGALNSIIRSYSKTSGFGIWAIILKENQEVIGHCSLKDLDQSTKHEVGYILAKKYWNQGIATEVCKATIQYGFLDRNLSEIFAITDPANLSSVRVLEKCGLSYESMTQAYGFDVALYSIQEQHDKR